MVEEATEYLEEAEAEVKDTATFQTAIWMKASQEDVADQS
jgi:hypothetical protein